MLLDIQADFWVVLYRGRNLMILVCHSQLRILYDSIKMLVQGISEVSHRSEVCHHRPSSKNCFLESKLKEKPLAP